MNERILGNRRDRAFVSQYLAYMRSSVPVELLVAPGSRTLSECAETASALVDLDCFEEVVATAASAIRASHGSEFKLIAPERYYVASPSAHDIGGFHSPLSVGYSTLWRAASAVALNVGIVPSARVRAVELARTYLHDSLHHSTFCSFRVLRWSPQSSAQAKLLLPSVYREQYGFNFRNSAGKSYSSPNLTWRSPWAINLNLLMDGTVSMVVAQSLAPLRLSQLVKPTGKHEKAVLDDVALRSQGRARVEGWGTDHYFEVVRPAKAFIEYWGGTHFLELLVRAMFTGELEALRKHVDTRYGGAGAWERLFKQSSFIL